MNTSGYSIAAQSYVLSMLHSNPDVDIKVHYVCNPLKKGISEERRSVFNALEKKPTKDPKIHVFHEIPSLWTNPKGTKVGVAVYETIEPPVEWVNKMNQMDLIITASSFNKHVFLGSGVKVPIVVIPHCFDPNLFNREVKPAGRYRNLTFFAIGTWRNRKNWSGLIKGWYEAFERSDRVSLLIKTDHPNLLQKMVKQIKLEGDWRSKDTAPIYAEEKNQCVFEDIPSIMKKGDVYVSTSLGEGFGYGALHAMALDMPVIVTRFGGCLEYAKPEFCTYFEPKQYKRIATMDSIPQFRNKIWPVLTTAEIATKLRYVFTHLPECQEKSRNAYNYVHNSYVYNVVGKQFLEALETCD